MGTASLRICRAIAFLFLIPLPFHASPGTAETIEEAPYLLRLERGDSIQAVHVEPAAFGMYRYVRVDSVRGYFPGYRLRSIIDASGRDVTRDVLGRRQAIGVDPLAYRPNPERLRIAHRDRRTFPIFEVGVYGRLNRSRSSNGEHDLMTGLDFGVMRNLSRSASMGATVHVEVEDDRTGFGLGLRGRRWLDDNASIDGSVGWIFAGDDERGEFSPYAFFGETAINLNDHFQLAARIESWKWGQLDYYDEYGYEWNQRQDTLLQVGGRAGVFPGVPIFVVFLLAAAIDDHAIY